ncbi:MAG: alpha/beta hydrolase-fold protein [Planctomycetota bacterium]|nr:alpha/beta hydrolase-fold protein [Planctomycetota bacterium]
MTIRCAFTLIGTVLAITSQAVVPAAEPEGSVPGHAWVTPAITAPGVSFHTFESFAAQPQVSYHIFTPTAYDSEPARRFPVVYWLHGSRGGLPGIPRVAAHFRAAIEAGTTPPCLVVFVNGMPNGMYVDWKDGSAPVETVIVKELVPHIDATYRTIATREGRLLDGYSMGGYGAARLGFLYPDLFRAVSIMGGGPLQADLLNDAPRAGRRRAEEVLAQVYGGDPEYFRRVSPRALAEQHAEAITRGSLIRLVCGEEDETFANNRDFHEHLERLSIPHTWTALAGVDHNPLRTLQALGDSNWAFYRQAFGEQSDARSPTRKPEIDISFKVNAQERRAVVVNAPTDGSRRPVVIVLHGGMGSAEVMRGNSDFDEVARAQEGGMSRNPLVRRGQQAPFKPLDEVVKFWVEVNTSQGKAQVESRGTVTTTVYEATPDGAATVFVVDAAGGHGWPGSKQRREGAAPIGSFSGAERVWQFFQDKRQEVPQEP